MTPDKLQFRPRIQPLENRRLMAADAGIGDVAPIPEVPVTAATITEVTISGNTANMDGGGTSGVTNVDDASVKGYSADVGGGGLWDGAVSEGSTANVRTSNGNDGPKIITAPGPGGGPHIRVFSATPEEPAREVDDAGKISSTNVPQAKVDTPEDTHPHDEFFAELGRQGA